MRTEDSVGVAAIRGVPTGVEVGVTAIRGVPAGVEVVGGIGVSMMQATVVSSAHVSHSQIVLPMVGLLSV